MYVLFIWTAHLHMCQRCKLGFIGMNHPPNLRIEAANMLQCNGDGPWMGWWINMGILVNNAVKWYSRWTRHFHILPVQNRECQSTHKLQEILHVLEATLQTSNVAMGNPLQVDCFNGKITYKRWFSIARLDYQRIRSHTFLVMSHHDWCVGKLLGVETMFSPYIPKKSNWLGGPESLETLSLEHSFGSVGRSSDPGDSRDPKVERVGVVKALADSGDLPPWELMTPPFRCWKENCRLFFLVFSGIERETAFRNWFCWGSTNHQGCEDKENAEDAEEEEMVSVRFWGSAFNVLRTPNAIFFLKPEHRQALSLHENRRTSSGYCYHHGHEVFIPAIGLDWPGPLADLKALLG